MSNIGIAADHAGFSLKESMAAAIREMGYQVLDFGARSLMDEDDYPDHVVPLARSVANGEVERGIILCGSGVGACIAANKVDGVRAAICHDPYSAHQGVEHDDMNVLVIGARVIGAEVALELARIFLAARFTAEERHLRRLKKIESLELGHMRVPAAVKEVRP